MEVKGSELFDLPFLYNIGCTYENDGFIQFNVESGIKLFVCSSTSEEDDESPVDSFQKVEGSEYIIITFVNGRNGEMKDDETINLNVYRKVL